MIPDLPDASPEIRDSVLGWLDRFSATVREVDYLSAYPFWHPRIIAFGTVQALVEGLEPWRDQQWENVWPKSSDFRFPVDTSRVLASPDGKMAVAIAPFTSTGYAPDGTPFERPGRATLILVPGGAEGWLGVHSHMSLARGVPADSHGNRPVKAR